MTSEKEIEQYLVKQVKAIGGKAYKFVSPGNDGVPDRLVCLPGGVAIFVEIKAPGKEPSPLQKHQLNKLGGLGFSTWAIDDRGGVDTFIGYCKAAQRRRKF